MLDPAFEVASFLSSAGLGLEMGSSLFVSTIRDLGKPELIDGTVVFVYGRAGRIPTRTMGEVYEIRYPIINLSVISPRYADGRSLAIKILNKLRLSRQSGYQPLPFLDLESLQSEPDAGGQDPNGKFIWNMSFVAKYEER